MGTPFNPIENSQNSNRFCGDRRRRGPHAVRSQSILNILEVLIDVPVCRHRAWRVTREAPVMTVATIQHLVDHRAIEDLRRLCGDKAVVTEITVLAATAPKRDDV
jgi:hypothetical protein